MKSRSIRIGILKAIIKASNQAYGNISCDDDLKFDKKDKKQIARELISDENILRLTKNYRGNDYGRRY